MHDEKRPQHPGIGNAEPGGFEEETGRPDPTGGPADSGAAPPRTQIPEGYFIAVIAQCQACAMIMAIESSQVITLATRQKLIHAKCGKCGYLNNVKPRKAPKKPMLSKPTAAEISKFRR